MSNLIQCGRYLVRDANKRSSEYKAAAIIMFISTASLWYSQVRIVKRVMIASRRKTSKHAMYGTERKIRDYWILWDADRILVPVNTNI